MRALRAEYWLPYLRCLDAQRRAGAGYNLVTIALT